MRLVLVTVLRPPSRDDPDQCELVLSWPRDMTLGAAVPGRQRRCSSRSRGAANAAPKRARLAAATGQITDVRLACDDLDGRLDRAVGVG